MRFLYSILYIAIFFQAFVIADAKPKGSENVDIFVLDAHAVIENSAAFKSIQTQIDAKQEELKYKALEQQADMHRSYKNLERNKNKLSEAEYEVEVRKLREEAQQLNRQAYANKILLDKALNEATHHIDEILDEIIAKFIKNLGNEAIIINKVYTLYSPKALDITDFVAQELNARALQIKVPFDAALEN